MVLAAMTWLPSAQRRLERRRRGVRLLALVLAGAEVLAVRPLQAARPPARLAARLAVPLAARLAVRPAVPLAAPLAAPLAVPLAARVAPVDPPDASADQRPIDDRAAGLPDCPDEPDAAPPSEALALKNAAQEMRAAQSWAKASRLFREAVEELPACDAYADERLLWTLLAVDTFEQTGARDEDGELLRTTDATVRHLDQTPHGRLLPDYPRVVAARDELRAGTPWYLRRDPPSPSRAPLATRLGVGMMLSGAPALLTGTILAGVYSARAGHLSQELTGPGGVYEQWTALGCPALAEAGEPGGCAGLRDSRSDLREQGFAANRVVIGSLVLVGVGAAFIVAGLGSYLHGRRLQRRQRAQLHLLPAPGGLTLVGRF